MTSVTAPTGYELSCDLARMDVSAIHDFLVGSYWARGIPREVVARSLRGSLCFGVFHRGEQVGFARAISDRATFAYLCDVYVLEQHRGRGVGRWLVAQVLAHPELQGVRGFLLATDDAHGLYAQLGFLPVEGSRKLMRIQRRDPYGAGA
jgi:GNAT superfamily N-acetyltransferase